MANLYHLEALFLIRIDELKNADKKIVKKKNKLIKKFLDKAGETLNVHAVPTLAKIPLPFTPIVNYVILPFQESILTNEYKDIYEKCVNENYYPVLFTNRPMASNNKKFPNLIQLEIERMKMKFQFYANKFQLDIDFYAQVYETEREHQGFIKGEKPTGMKVVQSYTGSFRKNV